MDTDPSRKSSLLVGSSLIVFILLFVCLCVFLSLSLFRPLQTAAADALPVEFSSGRAMNRVAQIAKAPHPVGSAAHKQVRDYVLNELTTLGIKSEVQETSVSNIVGRLKGTQNTKALLLVSHYDTVQNSPGAADDSSGVALMLEIARALLASGPLNNDVIFLFSDGEETGLLGAKAFVNQHPWSRDVGLVLNLEARGVHGPSIMFETSEGNGWLVRQAAGAAPRLIANSLSYNIYKLLPNDTDLTVFKEAGFAGLNFAFIDGSQHYHAPTDDLANLDQQSLQQQGANALALTRHFGNSDLSNPKTEDAIYFNLFGSGLIIYSQKLVIPLAVAVALLFLGCVGIGVHKRRIESKAIASGMVTFLKSAGISLAAVIVIRFLGDMLQNNVSDNTILLLSVLAAVAATATIYVRFSDEISPWPLMIGGMFFWLLFLLLTSLLLKGGSYLFVWPLLFNTLGLAFVLLYRPQDPPSTFSTIIISILAAPAVLLIAPMIYLMRMALTIDSLTFSIVLAVSVALVIVPFIPLLKGFASRLGTDRVQQ